MAAGLVIIMRVVVEGVVRTGASCSWKLAWLEVPGTRFLQGEVHGQLAGGSASPGGLEGLPMGSVESLSHKTC